MRWRDPSGLHRGQKHSQGKDLLEPAWGSSATKSLGKLNLKKDGGGEEEVEKRGQLRGKESLPTSRFRKRKSFRNWTPLEGGVSTGTPCSPSTGWGKGEEGVRGERRGGKIFLESLWLPWVHLSCGASRAKEQGKKERDIIARDFGGVLIRQMPPL